MPKSFDREKFEAEIEKLGADPEVSKLVDTLASLFAPAACGVGAMFPKSRVYATQAYVNLTQAAAWLRMLEAEEM